MSWRGHKHTRGGAGRVGRHDERDKSRVLREDEDVTVTDDH